MPHRNDLAAPGGHEAGGGTWIAGAAGGADAGMSLQLPTPGCVDASLPRISSWDTLDEGQRGRLLARPTPTRGTDIAADVARILAQVREHGDTALRELTRRFDGVHLQAFAISEAAFAEAQSRVDPLLRAAMVAAIARI